jgi:excisionase family DNA binding protein
MQQIIIQGYTLEQLAEALKPLLHQQTQTETVPDLEELLTRKQACKLLSVCLSTLDKHTKNGNIKNYGIGNRILFKRKDLLECIQPINH